MKLPTIFDAIVWDYDGTIVDSSKKNLLVTREIFKSLTDDKQEKSLPNALTSLEAYIECNHRYRNWREMYVKGFGLNPADIDQVGMLWSQYQTMDNTAVELFAGIKELFFDLDHVPHGICSQNCSNNIRSVLNTYELSHVFDSIIGHRDISFEEQKPHPAGFLRCIEELQLPSNSKIVYIGDHEQDVEFARNAELILKQKGKNITIISIAACYSGNNTAQWKFTPNYLAYEINDIKKILTNGPLTSYPLHLVS